MSRLTIKGDKNYYKEIIKLLKSLGGRDKDNIYNIGKNNFNEACLYAIRDFDKVIIGTYPLKDDVTYTYEEFIEEYPYKVGDCVTYQSNHLLKTSKIINMRWDETAQTVLYYLDNCNVIHVEDILYIITADDSQVFDNNTSSECVNTSLLLVTNEEVEKYKIQIPEFPQSINLSQSNVNEIEVVLGDYEFVLKDGKTYFIKKKPKYPKTYAECCNILGIEDRENGYCGYEYELLGNFQQLYICRNAYWKIAGEQMGFDKPWEPDYTNYNEERYGMYTRANEIILDAYGGGDVNTVLTFPTEEMRDTFYENFKDLIEQCKELL